MSTSSRAPRLRPSESRWPVADAPCALKLALAGICLTTLVASIGALSPLRPDAREWMTTALLCLLAIGFEEGSRRAARLQIRLSGQLRADMTSVWIVTGGVALAPGFAVVFLTLLSAYIWWRQQRPAGELLHRKVYSACMALLAALAAGHVARAVEARSFELPAALAGALPILCAIATVFLVARALFTVALLAVGVRGRALLGTRHDNLIEFATLCLGGLVALATETEPWLAILVIAPMVALQRGALVRDLEAAAMTDAKTGLLNAVAWEQLAQREIARAERNAKPLAILIVDIDRFKTVNDRFGHLMGDVVLRGIGKSLTDSLREFDGLGRFGGEEFVGVLPDADQHDALVVAERIRARVNQLRIADLCANLPADVESADELLSVSIGVAILDVDGAALSDLLHAADQALYRAKSKGRNKVELAGGGGGDTPHRVLA